MLGCLLSGHKWFCLEWRLPGLLLRLGLLGQQSLGLLLAASTITLSGQVDPSAVAGEESSFGIDVPNSVLMAPRTAQTSDDRRSIASVRKPI